MLRIDPATNYFRFPEEEDDLTGAPPGMAQLFPILELALRRGPAEFRLAAINNPQWVPGARQLGLEFAIIEILNQRLPPTAFNRDTVFRGRVPDRTAFPRARG